MKNIGPLKDVGHLSLLRVYENDDEEYAYLVTEYECHGGFYTFWVDGRKVRIPADAVCIERLL